MDERLPREARCGGSAAMPCYARCGAQPQAAPHGQARDASHAQACAAAPQPQHVPQWLSALQAQRAPHPQDVAQVQPLPQAQARSAAKGARVESVIESSWVEVKSLHCRRCPCGKVKRVAPAVSCPSTLLH